MSDQRKPQSTSGTKGSITGRDAYIVAQALYQACQWQEKLKNEGSTFYEWSNHQDMKAILMEAYPHFAGIFALQSTGRGEQMADLLNEKEEEDVPA